MKPQLAEMQCVAALSPQNLVSRRKMYRHLLRDGVSRRLLRFQQLEDRCLLATFTVTNLNDAGPGSLRETVAAANSTPGADSVDFADGLMGVAQLTSGSISIRDGTQISGPGASQLTIDANFNGRIFTISDDANTSAYYQISGLTLLHGTAKLEPLLTGLGGAIAYAGAGRVVIDNVQITGCQASDRGGAIAALG